MNYHYKVRSLKLRKNAFFISDLGRVIKVMQLISYRTLKYPDGFPEISKY